uniref:Uncharacterized protein n=1 Tax=Siphoviridae sp. ct86u1 TaxID=2827789 RepID=A0A8S5T6B5_9CAUD|nr:MAG TPA: hypothetical protein [Siphoviridae sp. ct86u1]
MPTTDWHWMQAGTKRCWPWSWPSCPTRDTTSL